MDSVLTELPAADKSPAERRDEIIALLFAGLRHRAPDLKVPSTPDSND